MTDLLDRMNAPLVVVRIHGHEGEPLGEDGVLAAHKTVRICVLCVNTRLTTRSFQFHVLLSTQYVKLPQGCQVF